MPLPVRTIPPWIRDAREEEPLPHLPPQEYYPNSISPDFEKSEYLQSPPRAHQSPPFQSRWLSFAQPSAYPHEYPTAEIITPEELMRRYGDGSKIRGDKQAPADGDDASAGYVPLKSRKRPLLQRIRYQILRNPYVPLVIRLMILTFAATALGISVQLRHDLKSSAHLVEDDSSLMAVIVDAVAIPYICAVTYDEYKAKPIGLRSTNAKLRIILLDLGFIVFESVNVGLVFMAVGGPDQGCDKLANDGSSYFANVCGRTQALAGVLVVALFAWLSAFIISILRLVERIPQS